MLKTMQRCSVLALTILVAACGGTDQLPQRSVAQGGGQMQAAPNAPNTVRYIKPGTDFKKYTQFMFEPVDVYSGADAQYNNATAEERREIANFMNSEFRRVIGQRYQVVNAPGPNVLRIQLTLAGIEKTSTGMAAITHIVPIGLAINAAKSADSSAQGSFMGSVTMAATFRDGGNNDVVATLVTKQHANAMDVSAMGGALDSSKAGVTEGATKLLQAIDKAQGRAPAQ